MSNSDSRQFTGTWHIQKISAQSRIKSWMYVRHSIKQDFSQCIPKVIFSYFSTKTFAVGTLKNRLNEKVLLSTQNIC